MCTKIAFSQATKRKFLCGLFRSEECGKPATKKDIHPQNSTFRKTRYVEEAVHIPFFENRLQKRIF